ncbi:MarR family winged helix-turn-helix transcriptional regulator [Fodinicola acaciae]|uniref:MarR family winged helix-turn-helix transcriptional regulator n=1 Tax=Fodinicola acaciae TaxID=2681555 RepID=UPI0013CFAF0F|nr:MarR family winged helix-turn-helix transcriptional regulator [Fodinicola acaciae]
MTDPVPLARLFAMGFDHMIDNLHTRLAERGWRDVRPAFGFVLLAVRSGPRTATEIAALLGTTKQAASKLVMAMDEAGFVSHAAHPGDSRAKLVGLTERGERLLAAVDGIYRDLEDEWAAVIGSDRLERLRTDLTTALRASHDGQLPPVRPAAE